MVKRLVTLGIIIQGFNLFGQAAYQKSADELINQAVVDKQCVGIAAGFSIEGEVKWMGSVGYSDLENNKLFEVSSGARIASATKPMTAIAIMQLYELGLVDLDVPIQTYLPDFPVKKEGAITTRHLLQHASGIGAYKSNKEQENKTNYPTMADAVAIFKDRDLVAEPGKDFNYTTYGYVVLGLIIEKVTGMKYEAYMRTNIWDKAGMTNTGVEYANAKPEGEGKIYHRNDKGKIKEADRTDLSDRIPGGGVYSNVPDMLKFGDAVLSNKLIKESTFKMMIESSGLKKEGNAYGLGWYLYGVNPTHGNVVGHNGGQTGASSFLMLLPDRKTTIMVLSNTSGALQRVSDITIKLFDISAAAE